MITIYPAKWEDFSTLGLGTLEPSECEIEERAGGLYELRLRQPITADNRAFLLKNDRIIRAEAPARRRRRSRSTRCRARRRCARYGR